jgi:hypothetical protein
MTLENITNYEIDIEDLKAMLEACNAWNGAFDDLRWEYNDDDFFDTYFHGDVMGAIRAVTFGDYNYNDDYVKFNGYGNVISGSEWDVEQDIMDYKKEIITEYLEQYESNPNYFDYASDLNDVDLIALIDEYEEEKEEEGDE